MTDQYLPTQVPNFELNINDQQLQNLLRDIQFTVNNQATELERLKKELQRKPSDFLISEANILLGTEIDIDPMLVRLLKSKDRKKPEETGVIKKSARDLGKKLNMLSDAVNYMYEQSKAHEKRINGFETDIPKDIAQRHKGVEKRFDELRQSFASDVAGLSERVELRHNEMAEQLREVEKKTLWQINDCKVALQRRITDQYVKDSMAELETKLTNRMKEYQVRSNIDPDRIIKLEGRIAKLDNDFSLSSVELAQRLKNLAEKMELSLVTKNHFKQDRVEIEKRLVLLNTNLSDINRRLSANETVSFENTTAIKKISNGLELTDKQVRRINEVLKHLKLGEEFQKMIEKLDPHKICQMDGQIDSLLLAGDRLEKDMDMLKKEIDKLRSKNSFVASMQIQPGSSPSKPKRQEIEDIVVETLNNNLYIKKMQQMEATVADFKLNSDQLMALEKKVSKMQKESELHNIVFQMKGLEEYIKREVLILGNRVTYLEVQFKDDQKNKSNRPTSASKTLLNSRSNSSVNVKKLFPVNCIGCYDTPGVFDAPQYNRAKAFTAMSSRK